MSSPSTEKLQKVLARTGLVSRRQAELWIREGRVQVNYHPATVGERVGCGDDIRVNGQRINLAKPGYQQVLCYYKASGEICTRFDPQKRTTIFERLPPLKQGRWISVGRLDLNTAGLLLFTTDGELAYRLMHPSYQVEREYAVRILGSVDENMLRRLKIGVDFEEGKAKFKHITDAGGRGINHWYHVTLTEGRKHEVRRLWESQGVKVSRLIRIRFGPVCLPKTLHMGHFVMLDEATQRLLLQQVK